MVKYNTKVLGFGDNVVDLYEHSHMMYPGGNCVNLCISILPLAERAQAQLHQCASWKWAR